MSLTRTEWVEVWRSMDRLERMALSRMQRTPHVQASVLKETKFVKDKVEHVIGQMP